MARSAVIASKTRLPRTVCGRAYSEQLSITKPGAIKVETAQFFADIINRLRR
jgi:hypothetical protein